MENGKQRKSHNNLKKVCNIAFTSKVEWGTTSSLKDFV